MVREPLTDRQKQILEFIEDCQRSGENYPTLREMGARFGIASTNGVRTHLEALISKGYLKRQDYVSRGLELTRVIPRDIISVPVVGSVPAGHPIDATENIEGEIALDPSLLPRGNVFSLRVKGDSMKDAGIYDGDMVLVQKQSTARPGEIIVAIIGDEATVKSYFPEGKTIRLQPANDAFEPIIIDKKSLTFQIAGKVVGLVRRFS
jgi:repressor LexA